MAEYQGNFTEQSRAAITAARESARRANAGCATTRHLLLALLEETSAPFATVIATLGIEPAKLPAMTEAERCPPETDPTFDVGWSAEAKSALRLSMTVARELGHDYVGPAHLFLSLLREEAGGASRALRLLGVTVTDARAVVQRLVPARQDAVV